MLKLEFILIITCYILVANSKTPNPDCDGVGAIYGKVFLKDKGKYLSPKLCEIFLEDSHTFIVPDSEGIFYFQELQPNTYTIVGKARGFPDFFIKKIIVKRDSISLVPLLSITKDSKRKPAKWKGKLIEKVDIRNMSAVTGKIKLEGNKRAFIEICKTPWFTTSDSLGFYKIDQVLPGVYSIKMMIFGFHPITFKNVVVITDSLALVNFADLLPDVYPEKVYPLLWDKKYIRK